MVNSYIDAEFTVAVTPDLNYKEVPDAGHKLDLYKPGFYLSDPNAAAPDILRPLVIYAHGGGFTSGTRKNVDAVYFCTNMAARGYMAASIEYPTGAYVNKTSEIAAIVYMHDAIRWAWATAALEEDPNKFDTTRIVTAGDSAGAAMAIFTAIGNEEVDNGYTAMLGKRPAAVIDLWGPSESIGWELAKAPYLTNIAAGKLDKCIAVHGDRDTVVTPSNTMALQWLVDVKSGTGRMKHKLLRGAGHTPWFQLKNADDSLVTQGFYEDAFSQFVLPNLKTALAL